MKNYYELLNLNSTGLDESQNPYTPNQIKEAFRACAKKTHPDHNKQKEAGYLFGKIKTAYDCLQDPEKRKNYDEFLRQVLGNQGKQHLFIIGDDSLPEESEADNSTLGLPISLGIDVSQCLINADCSSEKIIRLAKNNLSFAQAVLKNSNLFFSLEPQQQFELVFQLLQNDSEILSAEISTVKSLSHALKTKQSVYENSLISVCLDNLALASLLFNHIQPWFSAFTTIQFLRLIPLYPATLLLIQNNAQELSPSNLEYILAKHPNHKEYILSLYQQHSSKDHYETFITFQRTGLAIKEKKICTHEDISPELIDQLGIHFFALVNPQDSLSLGIGFLHHFMPRAVQYSYQDKLILLEWLIYSFHHPENIHFSESYFRLLTYCDFSKFTYFLTKLDLTLFSEEIKKQLLEFVLNHPKNRQDGSLSFFQIFLEKNVFIARNFWQKNILLFHELSKNPNYLNWLSLHESLQKKITAVGYPIIPKISLPWLSEDYYEAFRHFLTYIPVGEEHPLILTILPENYYNLQRKTGFFPHLLKLNTPSLEIKWDIMQQAIAHFKDYESWTEDLCQKFNEWYWFFLKKGKNKVHVLLSLNSQYPHFLPFLLDNYFKDKPLEWLYLFAPYTDDFPLPLDLYFSGACLSKFQNTVEAHELQQELNTLRALLNMSREDFRAYIPTCFSDKTAALIGFFKFKESALIQTRIQAYQILEKRLKEPVDKEAELFSSLLILLQQSGVDETTLRLLECSLEQQPLLLESLLMAINSEDKYRLTYPAQHLLHNWPFTYDISAMALAFYEIALYHITQNYKTLGGEYLFELFHAHGPSLLPLFEQYELLEKLSNGQQLDKVLQKMKQSVKFINNPIHKESIVLQFQQQFQQMVTFFWPAEQVHAWFVSTQTTLQKNNIKAPQLQELLRCYPSQHQGNLIKWLIQLAIVENDFAKKIILHWATIKKFHEPLFIAITEEMSFQSIESFFGKHFLSQIIDYQILQQQFEPLLEYTIAALTNKKITFAELNNQYGIDLQSLVLSKLFVLPDDYCWQTVLHFFSEEDASQVVPLLSPHAPDSFLTEILWLDEPDLKWVMDKLREDYGIEGRSQLIKSYLNKQKTAFIWPSEDEAQNLVCQLLFAGQISLKTLSQLEQEALEKLYYIYSQTPWELIDIEITPEFFPFQLQLDVFLLLPLLRNDILSLEEINTLEFNSIPYQLFYRILQRLNWQSENCLVVLQVMSDLIKSSYFDFIQTHLLNPLQEEFERVEFSAKKEKALEIRLIKENILDVIIASVSGGGEVPAVKQKLHENLQKILNVYIKSEKTKLPGVSFKQFKSAFFAQKDHTILKNMAYSMKKEPYLQLI